LKILTTLFRFAGVAALSAVRSLGRDRSPGL
jgi:hypothetical protein